MESYSSLWILLIFMLLPILIFKFVCVDELTGNRLDFDRYPFFTMVLIFVTAITIVMGINSEDPRRYIIALVLYCGVFLLFLIWKCFDVYQNPKKYQPKQNQNYEDTLTMES